MIICNFSCGAASAVATKLMLSEHGPESVKVINAYIQEEHEDNQRFKEDCEQWFDVPIKTLRNEKYDASASEVFLAKRFIKNRNGSPCSTELKRKLLDSEHSDGDYIVIGYTAEETQRADRLQDRNPEKEFLFPLIDKGLTKEDCKAMISRAGIELPLMYRLGYANANCIACIKGGEGYFAAIREDFPQEFERLAKIQDLIGPGSYLFRDRKTNKRYSIRDIKMKPKRDESMPSCSFFCEMAEEEIR